MTEKTNSKDELFFQICHNVLKLEVSKGHLKWTLSDVAKESDITRSLIYYYFGKNKETILEEAYRYMIEVVFNNDSTKRLGIKERMNIVLEKIKNMPYLFILFYLEKNTGSKISEMISKAEKKLLEKLSVDFPDKTEDEVLALYLLELGSIAYKLNGVQAANLFGTFANKKQ